MVLNSLLTHLLAVKNKATLELHTCMNDPTYYSPTSGLSLQQYLSLNIDTIISVDAKIAYLQNKFSSQES